MAGGLKVASHIIKNKEFHETLNRVFGDNQNKLELDHTINNLKVLRDYKTVKFRDEKKV